MKGDEKRTPHDRTTTRPRDHERVNAAIRIQRWRGTKNAECQQTAGVAQRRYCCLSAVPGTVAVVQEAEPPREAVSPVYFRPLVVVVVVVAPHPSSPSPSPLVKCNGPKWMKWWRDLTQRPPLGGSF